MMAAERAKRAKSGTNPSGGELHPLECILPARALANAASV
jgi:hypothetical protein